MRSGFVAGDARYISRQAQLINYGGVAVPLPVLAASTLLWSDEEHVAANRARYQASFDLAERALGPIFGKVKPGGGFFLWLDVGDGVEATRTLWREAHVKVLPVVRFGRKTPDPLPKRMLFEGPTSGIGELAEADNQGDPAGEAGGRGRPGRRLVRPAATAATAAGPG